MILLLSLHHNSRQRLKTVSKLTFRCPLIRSLVQASIPGLHSMATKKMGSLRSSRPTLQYSKDQCKFRSRILPTSTCPSPLPAAPAINRLGRPPLQVMTSPPPLKNLITLRDYSCSWLSSKRYSLRPLIASPPQSTNTAGHLFTSNNSNEEVVSDEACQIVALFP
jgi:hypothetical protein